MPQSFLPCDRDQELLMPPSLREWLPEDHLAWFTWRCGAARSRTLLRRSAETATAARRTTPEMMVALLLYGYASGRRSSRALERACLEDVAVRIVAANQRPDHTTIEQAVAELFGSVLALCADAGLATVALLAVAGTKVHADASQHRNITPDANIAAKLFELINRWMFAIEADRRHISARQKVLLDRPSDAVDACFSGASDTEVTDPATCAAMFPHFADPRIVAGSPLSDDVEQCQLKPLHASDYAGVTFTADQWARLQTAFPHGACDYRRPGVGTRPSVPWLDFDVTGSVPLGPRPRSRPLMRPRRLTGQLLDAHRQGGDGELLALSVDQVLIEDATGTMTALQFEPLGVEHGRAARDLVCRSQRPAGGRAQTRRTSSTRRRSAGASASTCILWDDEHSSGASLPTPLWRDVQPLHFGDAIPNQPNTAAGY